MDKLREKVKNSKIRLMWLIQAGKDRKISKKWIQSIKTKL